MAFSDTDSGELAGVGGWLAFLVISLGILTPLGLLASTATNLYGDPLVAAGFGEQWQTVQVMEWSLSLLTMAGALYLAWRLMYRHVWQTVRIVIPGLWLLSVGSLGAELAGLSLIMGMPLRDLLGAADASYIRPFVYSTIWTLYLLNSRRVANTYEKNPVPEGIAEVFE